jgi:ABC-type Fe3+ transport system substrate-binding protein
MCIRTWHCVWRSFRVATVLGLFAGGAASAQPAWQQEWDKVLAAAQKEGVVVVSGPPSAVQRGVIIKEWAQDFPKIQLQYTGARGSQIMSKVVRERLAGIYNWDAVLASTDPTVFDLGPIHALAPLREAIIKPDVTEDKTWFGGFAAGFMDDEGKYLYAASGQAIPLGFVNRACLSKATFDSLTDLTKPELKGKIVFHDPTLPGESTQVLGVLDLIKGEAWLKDLFTKHDMTFSRDYHQMAEWLVNCVKPVAIGLPEEQLIPLQQAGLGKQIEYMDGPQWLGNRNPGGAAGNAFIGWYTKAPHPNAAKVFVNWYLSREFQQAYSDATRSNSRRNDVKSGNPRLVMRSGIDYLNTTQSTLVKIKKLQARIKQWGIVM